jgi:hypothetical protein
VRLRRTVLTGAGVDRALGFLRRTERKGEHLPRGVAAEAYGAAQKATHLKEQEKDFDDATLAHKVETERSSATPASPRTGSTSTRRTAWSRPAGRGRAAGPDPGARAEDAEGPGVRDVENLLHTPGQEAPARA